MKFYHECVGGDLQLTTVGETPMAKQMPAEIQDSIIHASLTSGRVTLLGSDMVGAEGMVRGNSYFLLLECDSEDEIRSLYSKLSSGGKSTYAISQSFWGGLYGQLTDKFGNSWMLNYQRK